MIKDISIAAPEKSLDTFHGGIRMSYTRKPFLGRRRGEMLTTMFNAVMNMKIKAGAAAAVLWSRNGLILQIPDSSVSAGGGSSTLLGSFQITGISDDFVTARTWDGVSIGDDDVFIAKQANARMTVLTETLGGINWGVAYTSANERQLSSDTKTLDQVLRPAYEISEVIWAMAAVFTGVEGAGFLEIGPPRSWRDDLSEWTVADDDGNCDQKALFTSSNRYDAP